MTDDNPDTLSLSPEEARVLGCLIEKAATTPDIYPLSLNSLLTACNQKTNRSPVVAYEEDEVTDAVDGLRRKKLAFRVDIAGSRTAKYRHNIDEHLGLDRAGKALLAILLLRGPQTPGELRQRCERLHAFSSTESVENTLVELATEIDPPLWKRCAPAPGQKEARYQQLLCLQGTQAEHASQPEDPDAPPNPTRDERIQTLEAKVETLEQTLAELQENFDTFRREFE